MTILQCIDIAKIGLLLKFTVDKVADIEEAALTGIEKI